MKTIKESNKEPYEGKRKIHKFVENKYVRPTIIYSRFGSIYIVRKFESYLHK
jgi:hypothetical protein